MDADFKKIKKLTKFMRDNGLLHLKHGDIELSLSPSAIKHDEPSNSKVEAIPESSIVDSSGLTPEDILLWSAPGASPLPDEAN